MGMGGVFYLVFLLRAGLSPSFVLCTMALILIGRFLMRPVVLVFAKRWGLKPALVVGTAILAAQYPMLARVRTALASLVELILDLLAQRYILLVDLSRLFCVARRQRTSRPPDEPRARHWQRRLASSRRYWVPMGHRHGPDRVLPFLASGLVQLLAALPLAGHTECSGSAPHGSGRLPRRASRHLFVRGRRLVRVRVLFRLAGSSVVHFAGRKFPDLWRRDGAVGFGRCVERPTARQ